MPAPHHSVFTGRMPFLPPNQQRQSTEGNKTPPDEKLQAHVESAVPVEAASENRTPTAAEQRF